MMIRMKKNYRGFTLLEMVVSLFIFSLMMMAVTQIFASAYSGYRMTRVVGRDLENAQYALNAIAKALRTSSVVSQSATSVQFYDYSQKKCLKYRIFQQKLEEAPFNFPGVSDAAGVADCNGRNFVAGDFSAMTTGTVTGSFAATASVGPPASRVGRVTISLTIAENATHQAHIQTTVSLRDFGAIGL